MHRASGGLGFTPQVAYRLRRPVDSSVVSGWVVTLERHEVVAVQALSDITRPCVVLTLQGWAGAWVLPRGNPPDAEGRDGYAG